MKSIRIHWGIIFIVLVVALSGCSSTGESSAAVIDTPEVESALVPSETPLPTPTLLPPVGVLFAPDGADPALVEELDAHLMQAIPELGMRYQMRSTLSVENFQADDIQVVIALPPAPELVAWAAAAPQTRFLAVGVEGIEAAPNISTIGADDGRADQQGFLAGYLAAMITPDWRVGVISLADSEAGQLARRSFLTGAKFYCGVCVPTYPPFLEYPLYFELNAGASAAEWQAAADSLLQRDVEIIYLAPGVGDENLMRYIAQAGALLIGVDTPPDDLRAFWVASLTYSPLDAYYQFWPEFIAGANGQIVDVPISIRDSAPNLLSAGRLHMLEIMIDEVQTGMIELVTENIP